MPSNICPHCQRNKKIHIISHIEAYCDIFLWNFCVSLGSWVLNKAKNNESALMYYLFKPLTFLKIIQYDAAPDFQKFCNRTFIFFNEAQKRNIKINSIKILGKSSYFFQFSHLGKNYYYNGNPLNILNSPNPAIDNKIKLKKLLKKNGLPVATGKKFFNIKKAYNFGLKLRFPLVVKPNNSTLSYHVSANINNSDELKKAIKIAKMLKPDFIVEEFINGHLYRATIIGQKHVFICRKDLANVVGDGASTIEKLINEKNNQGIKGDPRQKHITLKKIQINDDLKKNLEKNNLTLHSILPKGQKLNLQNKYILSAACDIINCDNSIHEDNKELFIKIAKILKTNLVGIDFICPDISKSYKDQKTAVLEANTFPYIDMHQFPTYGSPVNVAEITWDYVLENLK